MRWPTPTVCGLVEGGSQAHLTHMDSTRIYVQRKGTETKYGAKIRDIVERIELIARGGFLSLDVTANSSLNAGLYEEINSEWTENLVGLSDGATDLSGNWK